MSDLHIPPEETLAESERRYRLITEAIPQFVWLDAPDGSPLYANERWLDYVNAGDHVEGEPGWSHALHPEDAGRVALEYERSLQSGEPCECECRYRGKDGKYRWFLFRSIPVQDADGRIECRLSTATDIDKQKRAETQQAFFALASDVLGSTLDVTTTLQRIARLAVASMGTWCQIDLKDARGELRVALVAHRDPEKESRLAQLVDQNVYDPDASFGPPAVIRTLKPQVLQRVDENAVKHVIPDPKHREIYQVAGYAAGIMVPLRSRDRILGVLGVASDDATRLYTEFDVATAMELGRRGAIALENAQLFAREHRVATVLQRALLPESLPSAGGVRFWSAYSAAPSAHGEAVGGDWYDAFELGDGRVAVSMGDVAGHGVHAAITMGAVRQAIRAAALDNHTPRGVLALANRMVLLENRHTMVTAVFGIYEPACRHFTYAIAGHPPPIIAGGAVLKTLGPPGPPLGDAFDATFIEEQTQTLSPQEAIVFYTDGLLEYKRDLAGAEKRLIEALTSGAVRLSENPAKAIIEAVLDGVQSDDIAVLVLRHP